MQEDDELIVYEKIYTNSIGECERKYYEFLKLYKDAMCFISNGINGFVPPGRYCIFGYAIKTNESKGN